MKSLLVKITERNTDSYWSWVVCFSSFFIQVLVIGLQNSFGTIFVSLLDKFGRSESETVWVGTTAIGLTYFCGPLSTYLCKRFGCRIVACTGSVLLAISGFVTSFASSITMMYFTFGVLNGIASSLLYFSSLGALIEYFYVYLPTASGISVSGSGVGTLIITLLLQQLLSRYGVKVAFQTLAGMSAFCFLAGLAYAPLKISKDSNLKEPINDFHEKTSRIDTNNDKQNTRGCLRLFKLGKHWKNKGFVVWTIAMTLIMFVCYIPLMYLVLIAEDIGVPPSKGGFLISIFAISSTVGKLLVGKLSNVKCANRLRIAQASLLLMAVSTCLLPLAKSYSALVAYCVVQGFFDGGYTVSIGLITNDIVGKGLMAGAVASVYSVVSIPMTVGPVVAGVLYGHLGDYNAVFFLSGGLLLTGMTIMFLIPWLTPPTLAKPILEQDLTPAKSRAFGSFVNGNRYDLSCVDEKHMANLFDESVAHHLLKRNRAFLDGSTSDSQRSSFVLFTIVSENDQRDISAYSSYQDLALSNTDTGPNFSNSLRNFFHGSHSSLFSTNHSVIEAPHLESIPEVLIDSRHSETCVLIHNEGTLETVQESEEKETAKTFVEEGGEKTPTTNIDIEVTDNLDNYNHDHEDSRTKETDVSDKVPHEGIAEETFASNLSISDLSCDSNKSSSSQLSTGTADSGFDEWKNDILNNRSVSSSSDRLARKPSLSQDISFHSYSCTDVSLLSQAKGTNDKSHKTNLSQDLIDRCQSEIEGIDSYSYSEASLQSEESYNGLNKKGNVSIECHNQLAEEDYYDDIVLDLQPEAPDELANEGCGDTDIQKNKGCYS